MLLTKKEIKTNIIYIISTLIFIGCFYFTILKDYTFLIASFVTFLTIFTLNIVHFNTFSKVIKKFVYFIIFIICIWMICNKLYYLFFSEYIILQRASTVNDPNFIINSLLGLDLSLSIILMIISFIVSIKTFKETKFRVKFLKLPSLIIFLGIIVTSIFFKFYNYEIITYAFITPIMSLQEDKKDLPITTDVTNMFEALLNKDQITNKYTGIAKGRNLILVQCESFQNMLVNKKYNDVEITPYFNKLIENDSLYFKNCFTQAGWGNTSDAEFITKNSFYAMPMESVYNKYPYNYYYGLPKVLKANGYNNTAYHGYLSEMWNRNVFYENEGIEKYYSFNDFPTNQFIGFGIADKEFFKQTSDYMKKEIEKHNENNNAESLNNNVPSDENIDTDENVNSDNIDSNNNDLEFSFVITLTSHTPFNVSNGMSNISLTDTDKETMFGRYIININYLDSAIESFINDLKRNNLYDNSIIVFYGDHQGLNLTLEENYKAVSNFLGKPYSYDDMLNVPLLIHIPGLGESHTYETTCGLIDVMPTILNLLGIKNDTIYFGEDLINVSEDSDRAIGGTALMNRGSFIDKDYIFSMSSTSVYESAEVISRETSKEITLSEDERKKLYQKSMNLEKDMKISNTITSKNLVKALLDDDEIVIHDVNPQTYVYNINTDDDKYNYEDRLIEAVNAGYKLLNVKVFFYDDDFYISNINNVFNEMKLIDFINLVKEYSDTYVILSGINNFSADLFRVLSHEYPSGNIIIPEIYSFEDYQNIKIYDMNTPILSLEKLSYTNDEIIDFVTNNKLFAIKTTTRLYNPDLIEMIATHKELFTYISDADEKSVVRYYSNKGIKGFYTNNIEISKR